MAHSVNLLSRQNVRDVEVLDQLFVLRGLLILSSYLFVIISIVINNYFWSAYRILTLAMLYHVWKLKKLKNTIIFRVDILNGAIDDPTKYLPEFLYLVSFDARSTAHKRYVLN